MWKWSGTITSKREAPQGTFPICAREEDLPQMRYKSAIFQFTQAANTTEPERAFRVPDSTPKQAGTYL